MNTTDAENLLKECAKMDTDARVEIRMRFKQIKAVFEKRMDKQVGLSSEDKIHLFYACQFLETAIKLINLDYHAMAHDHAKMAVGYVSEKVDGRPKEE